MKKLTLPGLPYSERLEIHRVSSSGELLLSMYSSGELILLLFFMSSSS
ncbi:MAG: hypothetical protein II954_06475 [Synergistaceae bacterium]|nr:hypothetical protein [Synergistaceae bacterium]